MRKTGMMFVGFFGILLAGVAGANVYKCANVYEGMTCGNPKVATGGVWSANCGDTEIKGISACGDNADSGNVFVGTEPGAFCFCKMIKPAVTIWIQEPTIKDAPTCSTNCDTECANAFVNDKELRSKMITNIVM